MRPIFGKGAENLLRSAKFRVLCRGLHTHEGRIICLLLDELETVEDDDGFSSANFHDELYKKFTKRIITRSTKSFWKFTFIVVRQSSSIADVSGRDSYRGRLVIEILKHLVSQ